MINYKSFHNADCCSVKKKKTQCRKARGRPSEARESKNICLKKRKEKAVFKKNVSEGAFQEINFLKCDTLLSPQITLDIQSFETYKENSLDRQYALTFPTLAH